MQPLRAMVAVASLSLLALTGCRRTERAENRCERDQSRARTETARADSERQRFITSMDKCESKCAAKQPGRFVRQEVQHSRRGSRSLAIGLADIILGHTARAVAL
jgi:hypothetical protein